MTVRRRRRHRRGSTAACLIDATTPGANDPFRLYTVEFDGTGGPAELRFSQPGFGSSNLDDVVVRLISPPAQQSDSGVITYSDPDSSGVPAVSFAALGTGYVGTFAIGAIDGNSVDWNFVADNSALQFLSANQTVTQTYAVTLTDSVGGSDHAERHGAAARRQRRGDDHLQ